MVTFPAFFDVRRLLWVPCTARTSPQNSTRLPGLSVVRDLQMVNAPFAHLPATERMQVLVVFLAVSAGTTVRQFLALRLLPHAGVDVDCVVELLQDPVIPPGLP